MWRWYICTIELSTDHCVHVLSKSYLKISRSMQDQLCSLKYSNLCTSTVETWPGVHQKQCNSWILLLYPLTFSWENLLGKRERMHPTIKNARNDKDCTKGGWQHQRRENWAKEKELTLSFCWFSSSSVLVRAELSLSMVSCRDWALVSKSWIFFVSDSTRSWSTWKME